MSLTRKVAHNAVYQIAARALGTLIGLYVLQLLTNYLGAEGYGRYTSAFVYGQTFSILADFGLYVILIKKISEPKANIERLTGNFFAIRLITAVFFLGLGSLLAFLVPQYSTEVKLAIPIMAISFFFVTMIQLLTGLFQKLLQMHKVAIAEIINKILLLIITYIMVKMEVSFIVIVSSIAISQGANFIALILFVRNMFPLKLRFDFAIWKEIMRDAFPVALSITLNLIYFKADTLILSFFRPENEVGIYGAPYKILEVIITIPAIFVGLVLPILAASFAEKNMEKFQKVFQKAWDFLAMMAIPLIVGTYFTAEKIIRIITKERFEEFAPSVPVLQILIFAVALIFLGTLFGHLVVAINEQRAMIKNYLFSAATAFLGYFIFIPRFSYFGAAWMTVYAEASIMILGMYLVYKKTGHLPNFKTLFKIIMASALMGVFLYFFQGLHLVWLAIISAAIYSIMLYVLKAISKEDILDILSFRKSKTS